MFIIATITEQKFVKISILLSSINFMISQANLFGASLVASICFTSKLALYIYNLGNQKTFKTIRSTKPYKKMSSAFLHQSPPPPSPPSEGFLLFWFHIDIVVFSIHKILGRGYAGQRFFFHFYHNLIF